MVRSAYCLPILIAGCATCPPVEPVVERVPVPATLTAPCVYEARPATTGELLEAYLDVQSALAECEARMNAIRGLK